MVTALLFALASASFLQPTVPIRAFTTRSVQRASVPLALNTGSYRILSPCTDESVLEALVDGSSSAADTTGHWVVIMPGPLSLGPPPDSQVVPEFIASYDKPVRDGEVPLAAGRLRIGARMVERFSCSLPKEDPRHLELLGLVLDSLLLAWLQALPTAAAGFEELGAAANLHSAAVVERVGFAELESPDLTSLGRGEPIRTHGARLPAAIVAYEHRLARLDAGDVEARAAAQRILDALRAQEAPAGGSGEAAPPVAEDDDPWSAMRASSGY